MPLLEVPLSNLENFLRQRSCRLTYHEFSCLAELMAKRYLANYLRAYRKSSGLTQAEVAFVVGINRTDLWHYETGRREPSLRVLIALQVLYRIPIWRLFAGVYQAGVGATKRRLRALQGKLLMPSSAKQSKQRAQKLAWISARLNLPSPALL